MGYFVVVCVCLRLFTGASHVLYTIMLMMCTHMAATEYSTTYFIVLVALKGIAMLGMSSSIPFIISVECRDQSVGGRKLSQPCTQ